VEHLLTSAGLGLLFLLVMLESAGIPLPGETALIAAGILAERGHFRIWEVITLAAAAAIIGDNGGYWAGRHWGRQILTRWRRIERFSQRVLPPAERFFEAHGGKTVFIGRFVAILRFTAAFLAGVTRMEWWRCLLWTAAGGICWATGVGLLAFYGGKAAAEAFDRYGLIGAAALIVLAILAVGALHLWRKRMLAERNEP
jgi:membrane protein DedA with SNARE-associated domain